MEANRPWEGNLIMCHRAPTDNDKAECLIWIYVNDIQWIVYVFDFENEKWIRK
jgi:hypothetical protein